MSVNKVVNGQLVRADASAASQLIAVDTDNILGGGAGAQTNSQAMFDELSDRAIALNSSLADLSDDLDDETEVRALSGAHNYLPNHGAASLTSNGATWTRNADDSITVVAATATTGISNYTTINNEPSAFNLEKGRHYSFICNPAIPNGIGQTYLQIFNSNNVRRDVVAPSNGSAIDFVLASDEEIRSVNNMIGSGKTITSTTIKPMIIDAKDKSLVYAGFAMTNRELTEVKANFDDIFSPNYVAKGVAYNGDCNNLPRGVAYVGASATNAPSSWCIVITISADNAKGKTTGNYGVQLAMQVTNNGVFYRRCSGGTWQPWQTVSLS